MAVKSTATPVAEPTTSWENPLIPNKKLRQLYSAMVELRHLEERVAAIPRSRKLAKQLHLHRGEEACLVSTVLSLNSGDVTSESSTGVAVELLRGAKVKDLVDRTPTSVKTVSGELPAVADTQARLHVAIGVALGLNAKKKGPLVAAYVAGGELSVPQWKAILKLAATGAAPILFVVLPSAGKRVKAGQLSLLSTTCGVPGIPVDAADPVALYRVAQESMLRIRAGGGPVLMECISFKLPGPAIEDSDPIHRMQQLLLPRGVATAAWFEEVANRSIARLKAAAK